MALTIEQIQANITNKGDAREIINQIADYIEANPGGAGGGIESVVAGSGIGVDDTDPANPVVSAMGGLLSATVELTNAEFLVLPSVYKQIIAAQGADKLIQIISVVFVFNFSSGAVTNVEVSNNGIGLVYGDWALDASNFCTVVQTASNQVGVAGAAGATQQITDLATNVVVSTIPQASAVNVPIKLAGYNGSSGDFTGGDAANTLKVTVYYTVTDLS